jgi:transcriptional regulator with XRE-family HTH domain
MLPFTLQAPKEIARELAQRVKALRLDREWTQEELSVRAGIALSTYQQFERNGRISLERFLRLAVVLDARRGFEGLFPRPEFRSIEELEEMDRAPTRRRGRRSDAKA